MVTPHLNTGHSADVETRGFLPGDMIMKPVQKTSEKQGKNLG